MMRVDRCTIDVQNSYVLLALTTKHFRGDTANTNRISFWGSVQHRVDQRVTILVQLEAIFHILAFL